MNASLIVDRLNNKMFAIGGAYQLLNKCFFIPYIMNGIGAIIIGMFLLYWVIRFAVRDGIIDAYKETKRK